MDMRESYGYLMDSVRSVLDGSIEASVFEEQLREVFGCHAYVAYTLDKLVQNVSRQVSRIGFTFDRASLMRARRV
jgi:paired amphipathic helix protein Sin3a